MTATKVTQLVVGAVSAVLLVSAGGGAVLAATKPPANWAMFGFELTTVLAACFGLVFAMGRFKDVPALTLCIIAGTIFVGAVLSSLGFDRALFGLSKRIWLVGRAGSALSIGACAVVLGLGSSRPGWRTIIIAVLWSLPLAAVGAWMRQWQLAPLLTPQSGSAEAVRVTGLTLVGLLCLVCVCAAGHFAIRAFELARRPS